jgi:hypothetical protein
MNNLLLCRNVSLAMVLSFWRRDNNHTDLYRASMVAVLISPITSDEGDPRQCQQFEPLLCHDGCCILEHPPYSPDMSPGDYDFFVKMKEPLRGTCYNISEEFIHAVRQSLLGVSRSGRADGV